MDNFKQASKLGVRFLTLKGNLSTEQLWQLSQTDLATAAKNQKKLLKKNDDDDLGFLDDNSKVDATEQLKFDILKDVYLTKKAEAETLRTEREKKQQKQRFAELIEEKKEDALKNTSLEELEKMYAAL